MTSPGKHDRRDTSFFSSKHSSFPGNSAPLKNTDLSRNPEEWMRSYKIEQQRLHLALEGGEVGLWEYDLQTGEVFWSHTLYQLLKRDLKVPVTQDTFFDYIHEEDRQRIQSKAQKWFRDGGKFEEEFRVVCEDGQVLWLAARGWIYHDERGEPLQASGVNYDITKRKELEAELKSSRAAALHQMETSVEARRKAEQMTVSLKQIKGELQTSRDELEQRVAERTGELHDVVEELRSEVARRKLAEKAIRNNSKKIRESNIKLSQRTEQLQQEIKIRQNAEVLVQTERDHLYSVLNMFPGFVVLKDRQFHIRFSSDGFRKAFGNPGDRPCYTVEYGLENPCEDCPVNDVLSRGRPDDWEDTFVNGRTYHVWMFPFQDTDGTELVLEFGVDITEQKQLERLLSEASDAERRNIGRNLHDTLGQNLTGLGYLIGNLADRFGEDRPEDRDLAEQIVETINQATAQVRALAHGLDPVGLEADNLTAALRELASHIETTFRIPCSFHGEELAVVLDDFTTTHLYRIAQEATNNAVKYAQPKDVKMSLHEKDDRVVLKITDDGVGLPEDAFTSSGMGLRVMRHRANAIGAKLRIQTPKRGGTSIVCSLSPNRIKRNFKS